MEYKFRATGKEDEEKVFGTSKICDIYDFFKYVSCIQEKHVLAFGQLKSAFGEPVYISKNLEEQYSYYIIAEDENGNEFFLNAYSGSSGPSIGAEQSAKEAAEKLAEFIREQPAADYEYIGYYLDGPSEVRMGIRDGVIYNEEEELDLTEEEFGDLLRKLHS